MNKDLTYHNRDQAHVEQHHAVPEGAGVGDGGCHPEQEHQFGRNTKYGLKIRDLLTVKTLFLAEVAVLYVTKSGSYI